MVGCFLLNNEFSVEDGPTIARQLGQRLDRPELAHILQVGYLYLWLETIKNLSQAATVIRIEQLKLCEVRCISKSS